MSDFIPLDERIKIIKIRIVVYFGVHLYIRRRKRKYERFIKRSRRNSGSINCFNGNQCVLQYEWHSLRYGNNRYSVSGLRYVDLLRLEQEWEKISVGQLLKIKKCLRHFFLSFKSSVHFNHIIFFQVTRIIWIF